MVLFPSTTVSNSMKVHYAQIVSEPESSPTLILAKSEEELLQKIKDSGKMNHLSGVDECATLSELKALYENHDDACVGFFVGIEGL